MTSAPAATRRSSPTMVDYSMTGVDLAYLRKLAASKDVNDSWSDNDADSDSVGEVGGSGDVNSVGGGDGLEGGRRR